VVAALAYPVFFLGEVVVPVVVEVIVAEERSISDDAPTGATFTKIVRT